MATITRSNDLSLRQILHALVTRVVDTLFVWQQRYQERRHLLALSDHMLKDIGYSRADIEREASKPFWKP